MDFVADQLGNGSKFRILTVVDVFTRQALAVEAGWRLRGEHVVELLNRLVALHGAPKMLFVDNGSEFTGRLMGLWAYHHVRLDFSRPGKPTDNSFVETSLCHKRIPSASRPQHGHCPSRASSS